jgi:predicted thioesterase
MLSETVCRPALTPYPSDMAQHTQHIVVPHVQARPRGSGLSVEARADQVEGGCVPAVDGRGVMA